MYNFIIDTDSVEEQKTEKRKTFFSISIDDGGIYYDAGIEDGFEDEFITIMNGLSSGVLMDDIINSLPNILENGDMISEVLMENIIEDAFEEDFEFNNQMEKAAVCQPAHLFSKHHDHDHDGE